MLENEYQYKIAFQLKTVHPRIEYTDSLFYYTLSVRGSEIGSPHTRLAGGDHHFEI